MSTADTYTPGPAAGAQIEKDGEKWTLVVVRELKHPPAKVWRALTEPEHLRAWAPFDADRSLGAVGTAKLSTVGTPYEAEVLVSRAEAPKVLEYSWGGRDLRWELEATGSGTRLTLWHNIDRGYIAMGAAGWHVCLDVLDRFLAERPIARIVGPEAMKFEGWRRLNAEYSQLFGLEAPSWPASPKA